MGRRRRRRLVAQYTVAGLDDARHHGGTLTLVYRHADCLECLETTPSLILGIHEDWQDQYQTLTSGTPRQAGPALRARRHPARSS